MFFTVFSIFISSSTDVISESGDFCCVTVSEGCLGSEDQYGAYNSHTLTEETCKGQDNSNEWYASTSCSQIDECVEGCCIFSDGSLWTFDYPVGMQNCRNSHSNSFFRSDITSSKECESYFSDADFEVRFKITLDNNMVSVNTKDSYLQKIGSEEICKFEDFSSDDYNYIIDCGEDRSRLGFGIYHVKIISESGDVVATFEENIDVPNSADVETEENKKLIYSFALQGEEQKTTSISGIVVDEETQNAIADAKVTISGYSESNSQMSNEARQALTESSGAFTIENVPVIKDEDGTYKTRKITVIANGYNIWLGDIKVLEGGNKKVLVNLTKQEQDSATQKYCCPDLLGCKGDFSEGDVCYAGNNQYGRECPGTSPFEACNIQAKFCCKDKLLCKSPSNDAGCTDAFPQACTQPCLPEVECKKNIAINSVCKCKNPDTRRDDFYVDGYCCEDLGYSDIPCDKAGMKIKLIVVGKKRLAQNVEPLSHAEVLIESTDGKSRFSRITDENGEIEISLLPGDYKMIAAKQGFSATDKIHSFQIKGAGSNEEDGLFSHRVLDSDYFYDDSDKNHDVVDENKMVANFSSKTWEKIKSKKYHHIIYLTDRTPFCDWSNMPQIGNAKIESVEGKKALKVSWDIQDCLQLSWFVIKRKAVMTVDGIVEYQDQDWKEIAHVSAGETTYIDDNVEWSKKFKLYEDRFPIISEDDEIFSNADKKLASPTRDKVEVWTYKYKVQPIFSNGPEGIAYEIPYEKEMGDVFCEDKVELENEFCGFKGNPYQGPPQSGNVFSQYPQSQTISRILGMRNLRLHCNNDNQIQRIDYDVWDCTSNELGKEVSWEYDDISGYTFYLGPSCYGPSNGATECKERAPCGMLNVNKVGPFNSRDTRERCLGKEMNGLYENACTFQPYKSTLDKCMHCSEIFDCTDYTNQDMCEVDNCMVGNAQNNPKERCKWINTTFSSLGEGVCLPAEIKPSDDFCSVASRDNNPFEMNLGWSNDFCQILGNCYASIEGCKNCDGPEGKETCSDYDTEFECTGKEGIEISIQYPVLDPNNPNKEGLLYSCGGNLTNQYGPDSFYNYSTDGCRKRVCMWNEGSASLRKCQRDANGNGLADFFDESGSWNEMDMTPAEISFVDASVPFALDVHQVMHLRADENLLSSANNWLVDNSSRYGFKYCIDQNNTCCPYLTGSIENIGEDMADITVPVSTNEFVEENGDGNYYVRFYAQDSNLLITPLDSMPVLVDLTRPTYSVESSELLVPGKEEHTLLRFNIKSTGKDAISGATETIACKYDLIDVHGNKQEPVAVPQEGLFSDNHRIEYIVKDGLYKLYLECSDSAGNINKTHAKSSDNPVDILRADRIEGFDIISPPDGGAIIDWNNVIFEAETPEVKSRCTLWYYDKWHKELDTEPSFNHRVQVLQIDESKKVFDEAFKFVCIEDTEEQKMLTIPITFVIDKVPPVTSYKAYGIPLEQGGKNEITQKMYEDERPLRNEFGKRFIFEGMYYYNNNVSLEFDCHDAPIDEKYPQLYAGCNENFVNYCLVGIDDKQMSFVCDPYSSNATDYDGSFEEQESSFTVCFGSEDNIDLSHNDLTYDVANQESPRCISFFIDKIPPSIDYNVMTEEKSGEKYYTEKEKVSFRTTIFDKKLKEYNIYMKTASGDIFEAEDLSVTQQEDSLALTLEGSFELSEYYNGYGTNYIYFVAEDMHGNINTKIAELYYDTQEPIVRDYKINGENNVKVVEYGTPLDITFSLDDVFWTHNITNVEVNVYSTSFETLSSYYESGKITPNLINSQSNSSHVLFDDDTMALVRNAYRDRSLYDKEVKNIIDSLAHWKTYGFKITPEFDSFTRMYDVSVGEYIIEIKAEDPFSDNTGRYLTEYIRFNVSDSDPPDIDLFEPRRRKLINGKIDYRSVLSNDVNEEFVVYTNQPAYCYFDIGNDPTLTEKMIPDVKRRKHTYTLKDFDPYEKLVVPFVISCTEHGVDYDLTTETFNLIFDRTPLSLSVNMSKGTLPIGVYQNHVNEYQLDYKKKSSRELRPVVSIADRNDKLITCEFECNSPNSMCLEQKGRIGGRGDYKGIQKRDFEFEIGSITKPYAWGDYLFTITCEDEFGNSGQTEDVVVSIRDSSAPQKLLIVDSFPKDKTQYSDNISFSVTTNMLTDCYLVFEKPSGIPQQSMQKEPSLSHQLYKEMSSGEYLYKYECSLTTDKSEKVTSEVFTLNVKADQPKITEVVQKQYRDKKFLPIFNLVGVDSEIIGINYEVKNNLSANYTLSGKIKSYNTQSLVIPKINPGQVLYLAGVDKAGRTTETMSVEVSEHTIPLTAVNITYVKSKEGNYERPLKPNEKNEYYFSEEMISSAIRFKSDPNADIYSYVDGGFVKPIGISDLNAGSYAPIFTSIDEGFHDIFILVDHSSSCAESSNCSIELRTDEFLHLKVVKSRYAPEIKSISPKFLNDNQDSINIELSKPGNCYATYPVDTVSGQTVAESSEMKMTHKISLKDIRMPASRSDYSLVTVSCTDSVGQSTKKNHLIYKDTKKPKILSIDSDNSVKSSKGVGSIEKQTHEFTVVRDEKAHIMLTADEYVRCTYKNEKGIIKEFDDYFLHNLHPHVSLEASQEGTTYEIVCEDESRRKSQTIKVNIKKDLEHSIYLHDSYPKGGPTKDRFPDIEIYTLRPADCIVDVDDTSEGTLLFQVLTDLFSSSYQGSVQMQREIVGHKYRYHASLSTSGVGKVGLVPGKKYVARISCELSDLTGPQSDSEKVVQFWYDAEADNRPDIYVMN